MSEHLNLDTSSISDTDSLHIFWSALLVSASQADISAVDRAYQCSVVLQEHTDFWYTRFGPHLLYLLLCRGESAWGLACEVATGMASAICRSVVTSGTTRFCHGMMRSVVSVHSRCLGREEGLSTVESCVRLVSFVFKNGINFRETRIDPCFVHTLCQRGLCDLLRFAVELMDPECRVLALSGLNPSHMSPLCVAIVAGHLDVVQLLLEWECPLPHPAANALPEVFTAAVCLRKAFGRRSFERQRAGLQRSLWKAVDRIAPGSYSFEGFSSPGCSPLLGEGVSKIIDLLVSHFRGDPRSTVSHKSFLTVLGLLSSLPSLDLATPLLMFFMSGMEQCTLPAGAEGAWNVCDVVELLPDPGDSLALQLFDGIVANFVSPPIASRLVSVAARRGLWGVVERCFAVMPPEFSPLDVSCMSAVLSAAALQGNIATLESLLGGLQHQGGLHPMHLTMPLCRAVKSNNLEVIAPILNFASDVAVLRTPLSIAIQFHQDSPADILFSHLDSHLVLERSLFFSILKVATRYNNCNTVERLLRRCNKVQGLVESEFWREVFFVAVKFGHEGLALQAVGAVAESVLREWERDPGYLTVLNQCCFWGLSDVLQCIPFTREKLYAKISSYCPKSPVATAMVGGHIKRLSELECFDGTDGSEVDLPSWHFFHGAFHHIASRDVERREYHNYRDNILTGSVKTEDGHLRIFAEAAFFGLASTFDAYLEHLGRYANVGGGEFMVDLLKMACTKRNNLSIVNRALRCLDCTAVECWSAYRKVFTLCVSRGEVEYAKTFVRVIPKLIDDLCSCKCLHHAVCSGSPMMVDYILELLGGDAPDECFSRNQHEEYPLCLAFSLGRHCVLTGSSLVPVAAKSDFFGREIDPNWREFAAKLYGWFDLMMQENAALPPMNNQSSLVGRHSLKSLHRIANIVLLPDPIVESLLTKTSGAIFPECMFETLWEALLTSSNIPHAIYRHFDVTGHKMNAIKLIREHREKNGARLDNIRRSSRVEESLVLLEIRGDTLGDEDLMKMYENACLLGAREVVEKLLSTRKDIFTEEVKLLGVEQAALLGHFKLAAFLRLKMKGGRRFAIPFHNISHGYVFDIGLSYSKILNAFFLSLSEKGRVSLSSLWLTRNWCEEERKLVGRKLGGTSNITSAPNPWVFTSEQGEELSVVIDWNSFHESILMPPSEFVADAALTRLRSEYPDVPPLLLNTDFRYVPLFIESIVFSNAVLGLLSPRCAPNEFRPRDPEAAKNLFELCRSRGLSSVIVTCTVSPAQPSFANGILCFVYSPDTATIHGVDVDELTNLEEDLDMLRDSLTDDQKFLEHLRLSQRQSLESLGRHYQKVIGRVSLCRKCSVTVSFDDGILFAEDHNALKLYLVLVQLLLGDIAEALGVVSEPSVLYHRLGRGYRAGQLARGKIRAFESVDVLFQTYSCEAATIDVSVTPGEMLSIAVWLPAEETSGDTDTLWIPASSTYEKLVEDLSRDILRAELSLTRQRAVRRVAGALAPLLRSSLKTAQLSLDFLQVFVDDPELGSGNMVNFEELDPSREGNIVYFKCVHRLRNFVCGFVRMLKVLQYKPRIQAQVCSCFEVGFKIVLSKSAGVSFFEESGMPHLRVSLDLLFSSQENVSQSLLPLFREVLATVSGIVIASPQIVSLPAPFASFVDMECSPGLLYPIVGDPGTITVQMVDYSDKVMVATPTINCRLDVRIDHVATKEVMTASSSHEPSSHSASRHLLVMEGSGGTFKIEWTPQTTGVHVVSISLNGTAVRGSPFKCFGVTTKYRKCGNRQSTTDDPIVCVVSHLVSEGSLWAWQCRTATPPPVKLLNKKPVRPGAEKKRANRDDFIRALSSEGEGVHHISMCSAHGGAKNWSRVASSFVSLHVSTCADSANGGHRGRSRTFSVEAIPLGKGFYMVRLSATLAGTFSVFASCGCCNSVLKMHWKEGASVLPSPLYVVPGAPSLGRSRVEGELMLSRAGKQE